MSNKWQLHQTLFSHALQKKGFFKQTFLTPPDPVAGTWKTLKSTIVVTGLCNDRRAVEPAQWGGGTHGSTHPH